MGNEFSFQIVRKDEIRIHVHAYMKTAAGVFRVEFYFDPQMPIGVAIDLMKRDLRQAVSNQRPSCARERE